MNIYIKFYNFSNLIYLGKADMIEDGSEGDKNENAGN